MSEIYFVGVGGESEISAWLPCAQRVACFEVGKLGSMPTPTKEAARTAIASLVQRFQTNPTVRNDNEAQLRRDFLDPFWKALGWDIENEANLIGSMREVLQEPPQDVEVGSKVMTKRPDYSFRLGGEVQFFVEAKKVSVDIESQTDPAFQTRRYGWSAQLGVSVLSNFDKFVIYDCTIPPQGNEPAHVARLAVIDHSEYVERFDEIYDAFSREAVVAGQLEMAYPKGAAIQGSQAFDSYFLRQIDHWRRLLAQDLIQNHPNLDPIEVGHLVQRLLNRVLFLRFCEDRELEAYKTIHKIKNYSDLVKVFEEADQRYDSGLFDLLDDQLTKSVAVSDEVLVDIFQQLYFPTSPYAFTVIDSAMLGQIYEHFISKQISVENDKVELTDKPDYVATSGAVPTPQYIVDRIIEQTVTEEIAGKSPEQLEDFSIVDIACGSGVFLLSALAALMQHYLLWYSENNSAKWEAERRIYRTDTDGWRLTLQEKHRILTNHIFGVDIDPQAVEATQLSLLLKIIEGETRATVDEYIRANHSTALPKLDENLIVGNSIVDSKYLTFHPAAAGDMRIFSEINPLDWEDAFPRIIDNGGFSIIVGNPPFVRIQNMVGYALNEYNYLRSNISEFISSTSENFDKYQVFIERSLQIVSEDGRIGYVVPNRFLTNASSDKFRQVLANGSHVNSITDFGHQHVFGNAAYAALLFLRKLPQENFTGEFVTDISKWKRGEIGRVGSYKNADFSEKPWLLTAPEAQVVFDRLNINHPRKLKDIADIFVGLQTSKDSIYIIEPLNDDGINVRFTDKSGSSRTIEKSILQPCLLDVQLNPFSHPSANRMMIFPYDVETSVLYTPEEMHANFPLCWAYLSDFKVELEARSIQNGTPETWYRFGRGQSLSKFNGEEKLIWSVLSNDARYVRDDENILITGGGNGPYYAMRTKGTYDNRYIQALLYHPVIEAMVRARSVKFRGNYYSHKKDSIKDLPIVALDLSQQADKDTHDDLVSLVTLIEEAVAAEQAATSPGSKTMARKRTAALRNQLTDKVSALYGVTKDEVILVDRLVE